MTAALLSRSLSKCVTRSGTENPSRLHFVNDPKFEKTETSIFIPTQFFIANDPGDFELTPAKRAPTVYINKHMFRDIIWNCLKGMLQPIPTIPTVPSGLVDTVI